MEGALRSSYVLRRVGADDLPLLRSWRSKPHVTRWWGAAGVEDEREKLADPRVHMWMAVLCSAPFAFMQDYDVRDWLPHHFAFLPRGSRGLDMYIGEEGMLGMGHGPRVLRQHVQELFGAGVPAVGIDPHPDNGAAIRAFTKAGFDVASGPMETRWGQAILMTCYDSPHERGGQSPA